MTAQNREGGSSANSGNAHIQTAFFLNGFPYDKTFYSLSNLNIGPTLCMTRILNLAINWRVSSWFQGFVVVFKFWWNLINGKKVECPNLLMNSDGLAELESGNLNKDPAVRRGGGRVGEGRRGTFANFYEPQNIPLNLQQPIQFIFCLQILVSLPPTYNIP